MALTRKMLKGMSLSDEQIDTIIEAHTETVEALKNERDELREKAEQLPDVQKQLDKLKSEAEKGNTDSYKVKYEALKEDFEKYKGEVTAKETKSAKETALRDTLKKLGIPDKRIGSIIKVTNLDDINLDKDGKIENADALEKSLKDNWSDFIPTEVELPTKPETPPTGGKTPPTRAEIMKIKDTSERQKAIAENIELFNG